MRRIEGGLGMMFERQGATHLRDMTGRSAGLSEQDCGNEQENFRRLQTDGNFRAYGPNTITLVTGSGPPDADENPDQIDEEKAERRDEDQRRVVVGHVGHVGQGHHGREDRKRQEQTAADPE